MTKAQSWAQADPLRRKMDYYYQTISVIGRLHETPVKAIDEQSIANDRYDHCCDSTINK